MLRGLGYEPVHGDFLTVDLDGPFDRILMNPPFDGRQDVRHVTTRSACSRPAAGSSRSWPKSVTYRDDQATRSIRELIDAHGSVTSNPDRSFASSGTDIATVTVLLDKPAAPFAGAATTACPTVGAGATHTHHHED